MMNFLRTFSTSLFFIVFVSACDSTEPLKPLANDAVILAFGDSLTYGTGAATTESYPALLQQQLNMTVINAGVPGEISSEGRARLPDLLDEVNPDLVILCHGGNDLLRRGSPVQLKRNLHNMIQQITDRGIAVLLIAVPEPNIMLSPPVLYQELAEEFKLNVDTQTMTSILSNRALKSDAIHPNAAGYRLIADAIVTQLQSSGAIDPLLITSQ
jgi:acyl-CoA thioesterase-1